MTIYLLRPIFFPANVQASLKIPAKIAALLLPHSLDLGMLSFKSPSDLFMRGD